MFEPRLENEEKGDPRRCEHIFGRFAASKRFAVEIRIQNARFYV